MSHRLSRPTPTRVTLLLVLLLATVVVAGRLAYEAHLAARSERMTAERALREYATMAVWEFRSEVRKRAESEVQRAVGIVTLGTATTPYEAPLPLPTFAAAGEGALRCADDRPDTARVVARLDLRTGEAGVYPPTAPASDRRVILETLLQSRTNLPVPELPWRLQLAMVDGGRRSVVLAVRYARMGTPVAVYAMMTCASAIDRRLPEAVMRDHRLLPAVAAGSVPNDSLLSVGVLPAGGGTPLRLGQADDAAYRASATWSEAEVTFEVSLRRDAAGRLAVGSPGRSNIPLLVGLLALTAALGAVALIQIRREHQLARLRADFTSSVSHELRTPLAQILLFGETLSLGRTRGAGEARMAAETIVHEARRLMHMVDNILHFARAQRGAQPLSLRSVQLAAVLREVTASFAPLAKAAGCTLTLDIEGDPWVRGDDGALRQILLNLLDNAVKYGAPGEGVHLRAWSEGDETVVQVDDAGSGIAVSDRARIWLPYVRLTRSGGRGGSGLGLAVVQELTAAMEGRVWVGDGPRGGAAFALALKRSSPSLRIAHESAHDSGRAAS